MPYGTAGARRQLRRGVLTRYEEAALEVARLGGRPGPGPTRYQIPRMAGDPHHALYDADELGLNPEHDDAYYPCRCGG